MGKELNLLKFAGTTNSAKVSAFNEEDSTANQSNKATVPQSIQGLGTWNLNGRPKIDSNLNLNAVKLKLQRGEAGVCEYISTCVSVYIYKVLPCIAVCKVY